MAVKPHNSSRSTSVVSDWSSATHHDASAPDSPPACESRAATLTEPAPDAGADRGSPKSVSSGSSVSQHQQDCDTSAPQAPPIGNPTKALFQKLPKEQYTTVPPIRCGLLSQLLGRSLPTPQTTSDDDRPGAVPVLPSVSVPVRAPLQHRPQHDIVDVESESEASDSESTILLSKSLAYVKLAEIPTSRRPVQQRRHPLPPVGQQSHTSSLADTSRFTVPSILPPPTTKNNGDCPTEALPQSPSTVRRGIIERELPPSWRQMLLHHRHLGRPPSRTVAPPKTPFSDVVEGVMHAAADPRDACDPATTQDQMGVRKRAALARWAWWADDYHSRGW
ncbi:hypothetical protein LXA43DRAFT_1097877 [Ganoderma leucocontextum]|nr:hypothetical protein LXA43DRAFT_1097877 [Ganoderma leucocontextum]